MVPFAPAEEQQKISNFLSQREAKFETAGGQLATSIDRLKEYRSALITSAVTGQIDVTKWGKAGTADRQLDRIQEEIEA
jgi:type I restriction enzyme S subunit